MNYETIILEKKENVATITLNRPEKLNALNPKMRDELLDVFGVVDQDDDVRAVIITGAGRAFCAGADIQESFLAGIEEKNKGIIGNVIHDFVEVGPLALTNMSKPVIAAINGAAVGFGCTITLACDIRIASENARFGLAFPRMGIITEFGSSYFLSRLIGMGKACELAFTARMIDAKEAKEIGLVNQVVPSSELTKTSYEMASNIAKLAPLSMRFTKKGLYKGVDNDLATQVQYEVFANNYLRGTEDHEEGARAFLEKREPVFKGK